MNHNPQKKIYNLDEAREKIRAFCVYRERSQVEVREKLYSYSLIPDAVEQLLTELIQENYLNEERFARAFVRGKFSVKKWGRNKIRNELYRHKLSKYVLDKAFAEIDGDEYDRTLRDLVEKKLGEIKGMTDFRKNGKVAQQLIRRGFEPDLVWDLLKSREQ